MSESAIAVQGAGVGLGGGSRLRAHRLPTLLFALFTALMLALTIGGILVARRAAYSDASRTTRDLAHVAVEHAARLIDAVDILTAELEELVASNATPEQLQAALSHTADRYPYVQSVWVVDLAGHAVSSSRDGPPPGIDLKSADFMRAQTDGNAGLFVSQPLPAQIFSEPVFAISRRLADERGRMLGTVAVMVRPAYFVHFWETLAGTISTVSLLRADGTVLARYPMPPPRDEPLKLPGAPGLDPRGTALGTSVSLVDGNTYLTAREPVGQLPLFVRVGLNVQQIAASWREDAGLLILLLLAAEGGGLLLYRMAQMRTQREMQVRSALADSNMRLEERVADRTAALGQVLRELNHRTKNDLQLVQSLIGLQINAAADARVRAALGVAVARIQAIGFVQKALYRDEMVQYIDLGRQLEDLARYLARSVPRGIVLSATPGEVRVGLTVDEAIRVALTVREVVADAVALGFPEGSSGEIAIALQEVDGEIVLTVSDDGLPLDLRTALRSSGGTVPDKGDGVRPGASASAPSPGVGGDGRASAIASHHAASETLIALFARAMGGRIRTEQVGKLVRFSLTFPPPAL